MSRRLLIASCLIVALTANTTSAQPPKPKDGPLGMKFVALPKATFYMGWDGTKKGVKSKSPLMTSRRAMTTTFIAIRAFYVQQRGPATQSSHAG